jgi:hypothetical protein
MPKKFSRLHELFDENIPEVNEAYLEDAGDDVNIDHAYPRYSDFLTNGKNRFLDLRSDDVLRNIRKSQPLRNGNRSEPTALDSAVLKHDSSDDLKQYMHRLHNRNLVKDYSNMPLDRINLAESIATAYMADVHPEKYQNLKQSITNRDSGDLAAEEKELVNYQNILGRELSGVQKEKKPAFELDPMLQFKGAIGTYNSKDNKIKVGTPYSMSTGAHEYLHAKETDMPSDIQSGSERGVDTDYRKNTELADLITKANNNHILEKLDVQSDKYPEAGKPPGETASFYNVIKKLLSEGK